MAKKEPVHKKMYKNSPRIESDEGGKKVIKRGGDKDIGESAAEKTSHPGSGEPDGMDDKMEMMKRHREEMDEIGTRHKGEYETIFDTNKKKG